LVYGTDHAKVDAICVGVVFSLHKNQTVSLDNFGILVILYNVLAFGIQALLGFAVDFFKSPRLAVLLGCILTSSSAFTFIYFPVLAVVLAGIGNALFHVGGGSICLNLTPKKASAPGIFVAPGALGLMIGTLLGRNGQFIPWPFVAVLASFNLQSQVFKDFNKVNDHKGDFDTIEVYYGKWETKYLKENKLL